MVPFTDQKFGERVSGVTFVLFPCASKKGLLLRSSTFEMDTCGCTLDPKSLNERRGDIKCNLLVHVTQVVELSDGYELVFVGGEEGEALAEQLLKFVKEERKCCSFLTFEVVFAKERGPVRLRIKGDDPVVKRGLGTELAPVIERTKNS